MVLRNDNLKNNFHNSIKYAQKYRLSVILFPKEKQIFYLNLKNKNDIDFILNKVFQKNIHFNKTKIFIHNHGIKGFYYDVSNYLTEPEFISSLKDKDVAIFFNYCSFLPYDFKFKFQWKIEINRYVNFLNKLLMIFAKNGVQNNLNLILSGFSRGCIINTKMLNLIQEENLKNINSIYLIEEAIPKIKFLLPSVDIRYKQLKNIIFQKRFFKKIKMIIIPVDMKNKTMNKNHPIKTILNIAERIDNDKELQQCLNDCVLCLNEQDGEQFNVFQNDFKYVKTTQYDLLDIKFCPQKRKIW